MHKVSEGAASKSYGLQVAKLAGVPTPVIKAAKKHLIKLESAEKKPQLELFPAVPEIFEEVQPQHPVVEMIQAMTPDEITPRQALEKLYLLKKAVEKTN
jgi:DNA mismatch repair protein MutS